MADIGSHGFTPKGMEGWFGDVVLGGWPTGGGTVSPPWNQRGLGDDVG